MPAKTLPAPQVEPLLEWVGRSLAPALAGLPDRHSAVFMRRFQRYGPDLAMLLTELYGEHDDFEPAFEAICLTAARAFAERPADLKRLDVRREKNPLWFQHERMMGAVCYLDRFAGTLKGLRSRLPYLKELGITYLHLMPLFRSPDGPNDGGYAVTSYRQVQPGLGTIDDLRALAGTLRRAGISLALDFVFNHTADNCEWALRARAGEPFYRAFYWMFPDRTVPNRYEPMLREIFPEEHPGAFTFDVSAGMWVWTTFHDYQWDLNYRNPHVFRAMLAEMLFLANLGVEVLRLDAVPFIWKAMGTTCEGLPQAHTLIRAFNALVRIAAPAMIFKSEAIVHPDEVASYLGPNGWEGRECEIAYHPLLMVLIWEALATRHTHLLTYSMQKRLRPPDGTAWVNYLRSHDDIGWGFADEDAAAMGIDGGIHRHFLNTFYTGRFHPSFASGLPFQLNPRTGDMRISGTLASLIGVEDAVRQNDPALLALAIRRTLLAFSVVLSIGGIPLLYLGDEIGTLNDYGYKQTPAYTHDSRWAHRPPFNWHHATMRHTKDALASTIFEPLVRLIGIRKLRPAFNAAAAIDVLETGNIHVIAYLKQLGDDRILFIGNFTEHTCMIDAQNLPFPNRVLSYTDLIGDSQIAADGSIVVAPYQAMWLDLGQGVGQIDQQPV